MGTFRFFLAFLVALYHIAQDIQFYHYIDWPLGIGMVINSFFVISGFIIILTLNKNYFTGDSYLKQSSRYYLNRILRIYPLYILSILFYYLDASLINIINAEDHLIIHSYKLDYKYFERSIVQFNSPSHIKRNLDFSSS